MDWRIQARSEQTPLGTPLDAWENESPCLWAGIRRVSPTGSCWGLHVKPLVWSLAVWGRGVTTEEGQTWSSSGPCLSEQGALEKSPSLSPSVHTKYQQPRGVVLRVRAGCVKHQLGACQRLRGVNALRFSKPLSGFRTPNLPLIAAPRRPQSRRVLLIPGSPAGALLVRSSPWGQLPRLAVTTLRAECCHTWGQPLGKGGPTCTRTSDRGVGNAVWRLLKEVRSTQAISRELF